MNAIDEILKQAFDNATADLAPDQKTALAQHFGVE